MTVKTRVSTQNFRSSTDNSRHENNSEKTLGPALGNVLSLKHLVCYRPATATRHVEKSGAKNCYIISGILCTSRFIDFAESRWHSSSLVPRR